MTKTAVLTTNAEWDCSASYLHSSQHELLNNSRREAGLKLNFNTVCWAIVMQHNDVVQCKQDKDLNREIFQSSITNWMAKEKKKIMLFCCFRKKSYVFFTWRLATYKWLMSSLQEIKKFFSCQKLFRWSPTR